MLSSARPSQGSLDDHPFASLLASLRREGFTGVLQIVAEGATEGDGDPDDQDASTTREVHFASGHIAWAISTDREESLKAFLVRHGTITPAQWEEAEERARQESLRSALTGMGLIAPRELTRLEISRVEEIISRLFSVVSKGTFRVRERQLPPGTPDLEIDVSALLINGVMETADRSFLESITGSLDAVFSLAGPSPDDALLERLTIRGEFQAILKHVNGVKSVGEICSLTSLPDHFVRCVFAALSLLGCVEREDSAPPATAGAPAVAGAAAAIVPPVEPPVPVLSPPVQAAPRVHPTAAAPPVIPVAIRRVEREAPAAPAAAGPTIVVPPTAGGHRGLDQEPVERLSFAERDIPPVDDPGDSPSIYDGQVRETSRGWFLVGAAMAVGLAAVFLILFSRDRSGAIDLGREAAQALDQKDSDAVPPGALVSGPSVRPHVASTPAPSRTEPDEPPAPTQTTPNPPASGLASAPRTPILPVQPDAGTAARATSTAAAPSPRAMDQQILTRAAGTSGGWSIQLLLACEDATVDRAVRQSGQSRQIFVLPVTHEGRSCHRVYWGRYADRAGAEYALQHDVPSAYRTGGARPWVTRLPS